MKPGSAETWTNPRVLTEAITSLQRRGVMTPAEFDALATQYRSAAFKIAGVAERDLLEAARDAMTASVQRGDSHEQATQSLHDAFDALGYERLKPSHAALVAEMAHATGYGEGQEAVLGDPRLAGILPALKWVTMNDDRVRPTHRAMEGHTAARGAPIWKVWKCPAGYRCRCRKIGVPAAQWSGVSQEWPTLAGHRVQPDDGFAGGDFLDETVDAETRITARDIARIQRSVPRDYNPGAGWQVIAVFARDAARFVRSNSERARRWLFRDSSRVQ